MEKKNVPVILEGRDILLRPVQLSDVTERYVEWMNDPDVNRYMDVRFHKTSLESLHDFVSGAISSPAVVFMAIILKENGRHIGNIKLGPINWNHRFGDVGVVIGEKDCWGKGYATEAISLLTAHAFRDLRLHKLTAGCLALNKGSLRAFQNAGFVVEGIRKSHEYFESRYEDGIILGSINTGETDNE